MRIRRNVIAPLVLTIGAVGSLVAVPAVTALTAVAPSTSAVVAGGMSPDAITTRVKYHPGQPPAADSPDRLAGCWLWQCERLKICREEFKDFYCAFAGGGARAPRGGFRHHRTVSQAVHVNRDNDQLAAIGVGLTKWPVADQPSLWNQRPPSDLVDADGPLGQRKITQSNISTTPCVHTVR